MSFERDSSPRRHTQVIGIDVLSVKVTVSAQKPAGGTSNTVAARFSSARPCWLRRY